MKKNNGCAVALFVIVWAPFLFAQGHGDPFDIAIHDSTSGWPQAAYNWEADEYLVVWEDYRNGESDIYGQFVKGDGSLKGGNFPIVSRPGNQYWPRLDYDKSARRYLIVFEDWFDPKNGDIRGIFVGVNGDLIPAPTSAPDHTFGICTHPANVYTCSVAFNYIERLYLVVWGDFRNDPTGSSYTGADVFGQFVDPFGDLIPPPTPADADSNFAIAANPHYDESVADVTYNAIINEFFVVYGTTADAVFGQRVKSQGQLVTPSGIALPPHTTFGVPIQISDQFWNGPDCFQARVQANTEAGTILAKPAALPKWAECEVVWKGRRPPDRTDNDVWGQRIGFFHDGGKYIAKYVDLNGDSSSSRSNHAISLQKDWVGAPEIAYSAQDNEFLVAWGDPRTYGYTAQDLYCQRLWVNPINQKMIFLADDRVNTVTNTENIPLRVSADKYEGSLIGIAHGLKANQFLVAFTFHDPTLNRQADVLGMLVHGSKPTDVEQERSQPTAFTVYANYPNPFNQETRIDFRLPRAQRLIIAVHDLLGREVAVLFNGMQSAGNHSICWNGQDAHGNDLPTGIYFIRISNGAEGVNQKVALVR